MAERGGDGVRVGLDFDLPDEILSVMPMDPYDQLDLARKITSMAIASRVSKLEMEVESLQLKLHEKDRRILELEDRVSELEAAHHESDLRLKMTRDDNIKILKERDSLALTTKKLGRDLSKAETVDIGTYDQAAPKSYSAKDDANDHRSYSGPADAAGLNDEVLKPLRHKYHVTQFMSPRFTPSGTPTMVSARGSPRKYPTATSPPKMSGTTSPTMLYEGSGTRSAWYPSSQQSSTANSPPGERALSAHSPRIDGKEFFRQARSRLSLEQFSAFLTNIKEFNAQRQSKEETSRKADEIFGMDNKDLYASFQVLLSRSMR